MLSRGESSISQRRKRSKSTSSVSGNSNLVQQQSTDTEPLIKRMLDLIRSIGEIHRLGRTSSQLGNVCFATNDGMQKIPCKYFQLGNCARGESCSFSHQPAEVPECTFFSTIRGCRKGQDCPFRHITIGVPCPDVGGAQGQNILDKYSFSNFSNR